MNKMIINRIVCAKMSRIVCAKYKVQSLCQAAGAIAFIIIQFLLWLWSQKSAVRQSPLQLHDFTETLKRQELKLRGAAELESLREVMCFVFFQIQLEGMLDEELVCFVVTELLWWSCCAVRMKSQAWRDNKDWREKTHFRWKSLFNTDSLHTEFLHFYSFFVFLHWASAQHVWIIVDCSSKPKWCVSNVL